MSNPAASDVHVDAALTEMAIAWGAQQYVWDQVCPVVDVSKQSDKYFVFNAADLRRSEGNAVKRAPATLAGRGGYRLSSSTYYAENFAWAKARPREVERNADAALNLQQADTRYVTEVVNRAIEVAQATDVFAASKWGLDITGASSVSTNHVIYWSTYATSTPIDDVAAQADAIQLATGYRPNRLWLGRPVLTYLLNHPDILDRLPSNATRIARIESLAAIFDVDQIIVGAASYNSAAEQATASNSWIHGKNALLYYAPMSASREEPSAMYTFRWGPRTVLSYEDSPAGKMASVIEVHDYLDFVITSTALGTYFTGIVA